jgi:hypothetical protein
VQPYRMSPGRDGLLFGYGNRSESMIIRGIGLLAEVVAQVRSGRPGRPAAHLQARSLTTNRSGHDS